MTGLVVLDIVIGLVFVYLLYSLLASIVQEGLANILGLRAKFLQKAIIRMLEDGNIGGTSSFWGSLIGFFKISFRKQDTTILHFTQAFYNFPLIKYLAEDDYHSKPSYISGSNFSKTILGLLRGNEFQAGDDPRVPIEDALRQGKLKWPSDNLNYLKEETLSHLRFLWAESQGDVDKYQKLLEQWFDDTMLRSTGWYKKHTQGMLFLIGFLIAIFFNVDTIKIADRLAKDPVLREQMVKQADTYIKTHKAELELLKTTPKDSLANPESLEAIQKKADALMDKANTLLAKDLSDVNNQLALGWPCKSDSCSNASFCIEENVSKGSLFGWLLTAFAISLGAPFWFDLLSKLMKLRGSVASSKDSNTGPSQAPTVSPLDRKG